MPLSLNEIKKNAIYFSETWKDATSEDAEAKSFLDAFFEVFGIKRKKTALFEHKVKKLDNSEGYIDLLWKGVFLVEMKSRGKDLDKAFVQAKEYVHTLTEKDFPKYILVCDFNVFRLYDTINQRTESFVLPDLINNLGLFGFISGYEKKVYREQDPVNIKAAELMGNFHDQLKLIGYSGHDLEVYLVRILFCLFAEDTGIFEKQDFRLFIEQRTIEDGSDLAAKLEELFQVLDTPQNRRFTNLDEQLNSFPYVNGKLFEERLRMASFDPKMRKTLLSCCQINWSEISPAIFGAMFQSVMDPAQRRNMGAHYTSEKNILKLIKPLFLDDLWQEFDKIKSDKNKLDRFHQKLRNLKFLDPACGCGNFLVVTYRELRLLELEILRVIYRNQLAMNIESIVWLDVDMMYGIEMEEFPARIAEVAMWLIDHQMNAMIGKEFGQYFVRLPLKKAATIINGDALRIDWINLVNRTQLSYILGNPPFVGKHLQTNEQKKVLEDLFSNVKGHGVLDYVAGWFYKAASYIDSTKIKVGFVSTNSIVQGEQVAVLWSDLLKKFKIKIHFAHRTFSWTNEARGNAAVL